MRITSKKTNLVRIVLWAIPGLVLLAQGGTMARAANAGDELASNFASPPDSARPQTWWHWMNGNITKEGITADLEAMKAIGINGVQVFNVSEAIPLGPAPYMSPQWLEHFRFAAAEADRLGMQICFHNCAGWSSSGGPWIKPEQAMQTIVTSEVKVSGGKLYQGVLPRPPIKAGYYRDIAVIAFPTPRDNTRISKLQHKGLFGFSYEYGMQPDAKAVPPDSVIPRNRIIDLTSRLGAGGELGWDAPVGDWTILRVGHTPTGKENAPAPAAGRGLEVDKLSREALDAHWASGISPILRKLGPLAGKAVNGCLIDSYEVGCNNWTPKFREEFRKRRGYDLIPFLPALTGRYVDSGEITERFLWDFRRTIGDLFADNYYFYFSELCHKNGLLASMEPYDGPFECLQVAARSDVVMGEFWAGGGESGSVSLAAEVARTHGIKIVGAESFTADPNNGKWLNHPGSLKALGDLTWSQGLNRFIFHCYAHQPWLDKAPGMTMGQWGTHFARCNTWWEQSRPWIAYVTRGQYLLQQGRPVADVLFFGGEASPNGGVHRPALKAKGYDYDAIGTDLIGSLKVKDHRITTPVGGAYRVLVLPETTWMTPRLARIVGDLTKAGATVIAPKPAKSPSLSDYPAADSEVARIADEVWGDGTNEVVFGKGKVVSKRPVEEVLAAMGVQPDCGVLTAGAQIAFTHRIIEDADIYFISNQESDPKTVECAFRVTGKIPELWDAESGRVQPAPLWRTNGGQTVVSLSLEEGGSAFVVFRKAGVPTAETLANLACKFKESGHSHPPRLEIRSARYGAFSAGSTGMVDVTGKLIARINNGRLRVKASNDLAGDPAANVVKELRVDYTLDGVAQQVIVKEGQELRLPEKPWALLPPPPRVSLAQGAPVLAVATPGTYTFSTTAGREKTVEISAVPEPLTVAGPWTVSFPQGKDAPQQATFERLISWPEHTDAGVKYFSGTALYRKTVSIPAENLRANRTLELDLNDVQVIAEVRLNGKDLGTLWKAPFRLNVTDAAKAGDNELEVRVTNLFPNRLIGDEQYPDDCEWNGISIKRWPDWLLKGEPRPVPQRVTFTTWKHWRKDSALLPSGLIGPVVLRTYEVIPVR